TSPVLITKPAPGGEGAYTNVSNNSCSLSVWMRCAIILNGYTAVIRRHSRAFWTCSPFSPSDHTTDVVPSVTSDVTSLPRFAGRQCIKIAPFFASFMVSELTLY